MGSDVVWNAQVEIGWFCKRIGEGEGEEAGTCLQWMFATSGGLASLSQVCRNTCLNGDIDPGEDCDDANTVP